MNPKYSVLLCNQQYSEYEEKIVEWLSNGIRVIWFSQDISVANKLKTMFIEPGTNVVYLSCKVR